jgi:serine/threonine protein kinase
MGGSAMPSLVERLVDLTAAEMDEYREWTDAYESAWSGRRDTAPRPDEFLPISRRLSPLVLVQNLKVELEYRARHNAPIDPVAFLGRYPEVTSDIESRADVLAWGSRLADTAPGPAISGFVLPALVERFPELRTPLVERRAALYREQGGAFPAELVPEGMALLHELPRGGMSRLALVWNERVRREEVLKLIDPVGRDDREAVERFRQEIRLAGDRAGCRLVPVYQAGSSQGHLYYTMPNMRGGSLRDRLKAGAVPLREGVQTLAAVARSVHSLHTQEPRLVHRDLKPENVLFSASSLAEPWLADLGLARLLADTADPGVTADGRYYLGTPGYMAPEQVMDSERRAGPAADIHALGAMLYELLTGQPPFFDTSREVSVRRTLEQEPLRPGGLKPRGVPPDLEVVTLKALRKDPVERFRTAEDLAEELERWASGRPIQSRPPSTITRLRWAVRRHPRSFALGATAVLALLALSLTSVLLFLNERSLKRRADQNARRFVGALNRNADRLADAWGSGAARVQAVTASERADLLRETARALEAFARENAGIGSVELGSVLNRIAKINLLLGDVRAALDASVRAEAVFLALPPTFEPRSGLARAYLQSGRILFRDGEQDAGEARAEQAAALFEPLIAMNSDDLELRFDLALARVHLGNFARPTRPVAAIASYRQALEQFRALGQRANDEPRYAEWTARTLGNIGVILHEQGDQDGAIKTLIEAIALAERLTVLAPADKRALDALSECRSNLGEALIASHRTTEALTVLRQALAGYQELARRFPDETDGPWGVAMVQTMLAGALGQLGRWAEALPLLESAGPTLDMLLKGAPGDPDLKQIAEEQRRRLSEARGHVPAKE